MTSEETFYCSVHRGTAPLDQRELLDVAEQCSGPGIPVYACMPCVRTGVSLVALGAPPLGVRRAP